MWSKHKRDPASSASSRVQEDDRRELIRIDDRLLLEYWPVGEAPDASIRRTDARLNEAIQDFIARPATVVATRAEADHLAPIVPWMMKIDWAMELVLKALARMTPNGISMPLMTDVNLSGCGICFDADRPLDVGDVLEIRLVLPPFVPVRATAEVTRAEPVEGADRRHTIGARFVDISADDRERVIRHILQVQAGRLRRRNG
jgi:hypothetical protein